jgi:ribosomal protein S15P/S13E
MLRKLLLAQTHWLQEATTTSSSSSGAAAAAAAAHRLLAERCVSHTQATSSSSGGGANNSSTTQQRAAPKSSSPQQQQQQPPPQPELVDRVLSPDLMSRRQLLQHRKLDLIRSFQRFPGDTGSTEVQVRVGKRRQKNATLHLLDQLASHKHNRYAAVAVAAAAGSGRFSTPSLPLTLVSLCHKRTKRKQKVALLTDKIRDMMEHARLHRKDQSSKRCAFVGYGGFGWGGW